MGDTNELILLMQKQMNFNKNNFNRNKKHKPLRYNRFCNSSIRRRQSQLRQPPKRQLRMQQQQHLFLLSRHSTLRLSYGQTTFHVFKISCCERCSREPSTTNFSHKSDGHHLQTAKYPCFSTKSFSGYKQTYNGKHQ